VTSEQEEQAVQREDGPVRAAERSIMPKAPFVPGSIWRLLSRDANGEEDLAVANRGIFDELVVDQWLHIEQMTDNTWWMRVGDASIHIEVEGEGQVRVQIERDVY
jgi:hypothetical protein